MKKIVLLMVLLLGVSVMPIFAQSELGTIGIGIIGLNPFAQEEGVPFLGNALWGIQGRLKITEYFGLNMDILTLGRVYWSSTTPADPTSWIHPSPFQTLYFHDEYWVNLDIGFYFPMGFVQPYVQVGPSLLIAQPDDNALLDLNFKNAFYYWYANAGLQLGYNVKFGIDFFISRFFSLSFEVTYLVDQPAKFFEYVFGTDPDLNDGEYYGWEYLGRKGYAGLTLLFWL